MTGDGSVVSPDPPAVSETDVLPARPPRRRREIVAALVSLALIAVAAVVVATASGSSRSPSAPPTPGGPSASVSRGTAARQLALHDLLQQRSVAILHRDRSAFAATLDPGSKRFRRSQLRMFANLRRVPLASWSYTFDADGRRAPAAARRGYGVATWSPRRFSLHYRLAGFDRRPTELAQYPTFVERAHHWYLASLSDFRAEGEVSATALWDYEPVHVVRRAGVLALGPASMLTTMTVAADAMHAAIPRVTAVWGRHWARRVVVLVPATQHQMALIDSDDADLSQIAALTSAEVSSVHGQPAPVGDRVTINPRNWPKVGPLGARIVLTHELTHVATRAETGSQTPKWLSEGFADYVGFLDTGVPVSLAAAELAADVRAGRLADRLPRNHAFRGGSTALSQAYEAGWLACRYLATRYGQASLVRFYRAVGTSSHGRSVAVGQALHQVFGLTTARFTTVWRKYVESQVG